MTLRGQSQLALAHAVYVYLDTLDPRRRGTATLEPSAVVRALRLLGLPAGLTEHALMIEGVSHELRMEVDDERRFLRVLDLPGFLYEYCYHERPPTDPAVYGTYSGLMKYMMHQFRQRLG